MSLLLVNLAIDVSNEIIMTKKAFGEVVAIINWLKTDELVSQYKLTED